MREKTNKSRSWRKSHLRNIQKNRFPRSSLQVYGREIKWRKDKKPTFSEKVTICMWRITQHLLMSNCAENDKNNVSLVLMGRLFIKQNTGYSEEKISAILNRPRSELNYLEEIIHIIPSTNDFRNDETPFHWFAAPSEQCINRLRAHLWYAWYVPIL